MLRGRQLVTLEDAAAYVMKLPKAEQDLEEWQAAVACLIGAAEGRDFLMHARRFLFNSSLISRACSSVRSITGRPPSNLAGARACLSQTIQPLLPILASEPNKGFSKSSLK